MWLGVLARFIDHWKPLGQSDGQTVGHCVLADGTDSGEVMVGRGLTLDYSRFSEGRYTAAQADQLGIWAERPTCIPPESDESATKGATTGATPGSWRQITKPRPRRLVEIS